MQGKALLFIARSKGCERIEDTHSYGESGYKNLTPLGVHLFNMILSK